MYGIIRRLQEGGFLVARIANPIYQKMLILTFSPSNGDVPTTGNMRHRYLIEGVRNVVFKRDVELITIWVEYEEQRFWPEQFC